MFDLDQERNGHTKTPKLESGGTASLSDGLWEKKARKKGKTRMREIISSAHSCFPVFVCPLILDTKTYLRARKNLLSSAPHSSSSTPPTTSGR